MCSKKDGDSNSVFWFMLRFHQLDVLIVRVSKRKFPEVKHASFRSCSSDQSNNEPDEVAEKLITAEEEEQNNKQCSQHPKSRSRVRTSRRATHAARKFDGDEQQFKCNLCDIAISSNKTYFSSNLFLNFNKHRSQTYADLLHFYEQNITDDLLSNIISSTQKANTCQEASMKTIYIFFKDRTVR